MPQSQLNPYRRGQLAALAWCLERAYDSTDELMETWVADRRAELLDRWNAEPD